MSWQKCVTAETYSLAVPPPVVASLNVIYGLVWLSLLSLELPPELAVFMGLVVFRSWRRAMRTLGLNASRVFWIDQKGRIRIDEVSRSLTPTNTPDAVKVSFGAGYRHHAKRSVNGGASTQSDGDGSWDAGSQRYYTCCRSVRVPGCVAMMLITDQGKPLEILVFYRYDQRQFYTRLIRHLAYC